MTPKDRPKSRLLALAPKCSRCKKQMKPRVIRSGQENDNVCYECENCGEQVVIAVPRA
jgi:uncharacterized Zn finger protein